MDYSDEQPERYWITNPDVHPDLASVCGSCGAGIDITHSIPVKLQEPLCQMCATWDVKNHPVTPTYLTWMAKGDPRWWSSWLCNCEGCAPDEVPAKSR